MFPGVSIERISTVYKGVSNSRVFTLCVSDSLEEYVLFIQVYLN